MKSGLLRLTLIAAAALTLTPLAAHAQWWRRHPAYLHAMSDLREAYWLIQHQDAFNPVAKIEEREAGKAIRAAYQSLKGAAIIDDKDIADQPPADMTFGDHRGRLQRAVDLLRDARRVVLGEEDDPAARGFKKRALHQIDVAGRATETAMHAWNF